VNITVRFRAADLRRIKVNEMSFELVFGYAAGLYGNDKGTTAGRVGDDCRDTAGQVTMGTGAKR
jgi:hypothetical protein